MADQRQKVMKSIGLWGSSHYTPHPFMPPICRAQQEVLPGNMRHEFVHYNNTNQDQQSDEQRCCPKLVLGCSKSPSRLDIICHIHLRCWKIAEKVSSYIDGEQSELHTFRFGVDKTDGPFWGSFWKPEACGQTVLPNRSLLMRQKLIFERLLRHRLVC